MLVMRRVAATIPAAILLVIIAAVLYLAVGVFEDARQGFCAQLEPCHTEETNR